MQYAPTLYYSHWAFADLDPVFTVGTGCAYFRLINTFYSTVLQIFALVRFSGEEKCSMYNFFYSLLGIRQPGSLYSQWRQAVPIFCLHTGHIFVYICSYLTYAF